MKGFTFFMLFLNVGFSQINTDSLLNTVLSNYIQTGTRDYLMVNFTSYESPDKRDQYDIYIDSNYLLKEHIGLSIVHYQHDSLKRLTLTEGFNRKGNLYYWDFPPRSRYYYSDDTIIAKLHRVKNELCNCTTPDSTGYIKTIIEYYYSDQVTDRIKTEETSKDGLMKLLYTNKFDGTYMHNGKGVVFTFREYDSIHGKFIVQERFYNQKFNLTDNTHTIMLEDFYGNLTGVPYSYSFRKIKTEKNSNIRLYNKKGKLAYETNHTEGVQDLGITNVSAISKKEQRKLNRFQKMKK